MYPRNMVFLQVYNYKYPSQKCLIIIVIIIIIIID